MQKPKIQGSGITLEPSGIELDAEDESGISLEIDDSGISLEADDSGISLESLDSGASLEDDSGITLDADGSGIALFEDDDSGLALEEEDMGSTMPMQAIPGAAEALGQSGTQTMHMEIPEDDGQNDSEFELAGLEDDDDDFGTDTSVLMFDDDEASASSSATIQSAPVDDFAEESFADEEGFDDFEDDFEDEEELDDVWDAEDEIDDEEFEQGESQVGGFVAPAAARAYSASDAPWGAGWTTAVTFTALFSVVSAFVGIELVRTMWVWTQPGESGSMLLDTLSGLF